ncbi:PAAR domain-containing protein [Paraburkholderia adhaesiva]|uniref:PAAR domain-containing protein n=1 Tax=Paraburkholderia adhaesiva TaxID=2883244 RepID=UPI001F19F073|nr:PAAR domain-containing protein [Paraburkholderia adhaesiva]
MRIPVVRFGDPTTTGGKVHALHDNMCDDGKAIALHGERATCGNCKGTWPIVGTGYRMRNDGQPVVLQGDRVLCPCGKNRVISLSKGCFYHRIPGEEERAANAVSPANVATEPASSVAIYDEQVRAVATRASLEGYPYYIETASGDVYSGRVDSRGLLPRITTDGEDQYTVYWGDEALAQSVFGEG